MAGDDHKHNTKWDIANYIEQKVRGLLEYEMNEYQDPSWVQAAELFNEIVIPCEIFYSGGLYILGTDIVEEAEKNGCQVLYQKIPGMYNVKQVSRDGYSKEEVDKFDCSRTINSIKTWLQQTEEWL